MLPIKIPSSKYVDTQQPLSTNLALKRMMRNGDQIKRSRDDKFKGFERALLYSYHSSIVKSIDSNDKYRALINNNRLLEKYDDKIISVSFESGFNVGTIFLWEDTNTYWLIYRQEFTELSYFQGVARRCDYQIDLGDRKIFAVVIGPDEKTISTLIKHNLAIDEPNLKMTLRIQNTKENLEYFKKYKKIKLGGKYWEIQVIDSFTNQYTIDIAVKETFNPVPQEEEVPIVNPVSSIEGPDIIKQYIKYTYTVPESVEGEWSIDKDIPAEVKINGKTITIKWKATYFDTFKLSYGSQSKEIAVR